MLTTTTSLSEVELASRVIFKLDELIGTSLRLYPTKETTSVVTALGTDSLKVPFTPVVTPTRVPFATMEAPGIGKPSFESVTLPVTSTFCAMAGRARKLIRIKQLTLSKDLRCIKIELRV